MIRSKFLGVGMYVPPNCVSNNDLSSLMDTSDEWIRQRTGIEQRYWVKNNESTSDLAFEAAKNALADAKINAEELDMIILCTLLGDHEFPGTACFLQKKLAALGGRAGIPALDVRQQCSGFIYAMSIADQFIRSGTYKKVLIVGSEVHSKGLDISTRGREVSVLFGDGAGAVILSATEVKNPETDSYLLSTHIHADGSQAEELWVPAPGTGHDTKTRFPSDSVNDPRYFPVMNGKSVFINAVRRMPEAVQEALAANNKKADDVDLFVFHQANLRINDAVAKHFQIPEEKVFNTIQKFGNTTAATIPIGLCEAIKAGKLKPGTLVASATFGSGFTWASALYRW